MTITNCPRCGSMNITTAGVCANCGWSQFAQVTTVSTRITGEIEIMLSGKALLDDYKRLLLENKNLKERVAELEAAQRWIPVSERLPEEDTDGNTLMAICRHSGEWVRAPFGAEFADEFVRHYSYWMYAPQPPEVQE